MDGDAALESTARERATFRHGPLVILVLCGHVLASCATRLPVVTTATYPSYAFPTVPPELLGTPEAAEHERAWLFLQAGDLDEAERGFAAALRNSPAFHPSSAGLAFVGFARGQVDAAVARFDQVLVQSPAYLPALLGRGEALLVDDRVDEAIESFEAALVVNSALTALRQRVAELRFVGLTDQVARARAASAGGRDAEARAAYERLIATSPQSGFLRIELAEVVLRLGDTDAALEQLGRAAELNANIVAPWMLMSEVYFGMGDLDLAEQALRRAHAIEPGEDTRRRLDDLESRRRTASLPPEYGDIENAEAITRGQLAAVIGVDFNALLAGAATDATAIITDARDHWAYVWILEVTQSGIMEPDTNYRFQPEQIVTRAELAQVAIRVLHLPGGDARSRRLSARASFSDLAPGHLSFPAASEAVAVGVLQPLEKNMFQPERPVSGAEVMTAMGRLGGLVGAR
jgi:tetratricopeptide (TPR) repeat protein